MDHSRLCSKEQRTLIKMSIGNGKTWKEVQKLTGGSAKIISNALKWKSKPDRHGRQQKTAIGTDQRMARMAKTQPMISVMVIKDSLRLLFSDYTSFKYCDDKKTPLCEANVSIEAPAKSHCQKKDVLKRRPVAIEHQWREIKKHSENGWKLDYSFWVQGHFVRWLQTQVLSEDSEAWRYCRHHNMGMFSLVWCWAYSLHARVHGSVCLYENTWRSHVTLGWRGNILEMWVLPKRSRKPAASWLQTKQIKGSLEWPQPNAQTLIPLKAHGVTSKVLFLRKN